jgi:hypothetical protein
VVEKQGVVDQTEIASGPQIYTTLETDHFSPMHSISCGLYFWNHNNLINYFGVSIYKLIENSIFYSYGSREDEILTVFFF